MEERLRKAYQTSTGVDATEQGKATLAHGIVVDKCTNKFMATYCIGPELGSITKIFASRQDAEFFFDSMHALKMKNRLTGNLSALRQMEATRKATSDMINKIMEQNVTMTGEQDQQFSRKAEDGVDVFNTIFKKTSAPEFRGSKVRPYKATMDQLQDLALTKTFEGLLMGMWHRTLGWRPTVSIILGEDFDKEGAEKFMAESGLVQVGIFSCGGSEGPTEALRAKLSGVPLTSECKTPLLVLFVKEKYKVTTQAFEFNPETKTVQEVSLECISRRASGETFQVLGAGSGETHSSSARTAATCL